MVKSIEDFYKEYRAGFNPITGKQNLWGDLTDKNIWNASRLSLLDEIEKEVEGIMSWEDDGDGTRPKSTIAIDRDKVLSILRKKREELK